MPLVDIFNANAFGLASMSRPVDRVPHQPTRLRDMGLFAPEYYRTETIGIESRDGALSLIKTSPRGAPLEQRTEGKRKMIHFDTVRIAKQDHVMASELNFLRQFGTADQPVQAAAEMMRRLSGPNGLVADIDYTQERMRLGAITGIVLDSDDSVIENWYDRFSISVPSVINFNLTAASPKAGVLREAVQSQVVRVIEKAAKGARYDAVYAECGDNFWDKLIAHRDVRDTYTSWEAAAELRGAYDDKDFFFAGVIWRRYRGSNDGAVSIATDTARFYPGGAGNTVFESAYSPAESMASIGALAQETYSMVIPDDKRDAFVDLEAYRYVLDICKRPEMLLEGKTE